VAAAAAQPPFSVLALEVALADLFRVMRLLLSALIPSLSVLVVLARLSEVHPAETARS
jgi:hypothetical protein